MATADQKLRSYVQRIERLHDERKAMADDISEVFKEAKDDGFDRKALKRVIQERRKDPAQREEENALFDTYWDALHRSAGEGPKVGTPVATRASDENLPRSPDGPAQVDAKAAGRAAFRDGQPLESNPYPNTMLGVAWKNAWLAVQAETEPRTDLEGAIRRRGEKAFTEGVPLEKCPFHDRDREVWIAGWRFMQNLTTLRDEGPTDGETQEQPEAEGQGPQQAAQEPAPEAEGGDPGEEPEAQQVGPAESPEGPPAAHADGQATGNGGPIGDPGDDLAIPGFLRRTA